MLLKEPKGRRKSVMGEERHEPVLKCQYQTTDNTVYFPIKKRKKEKNQIILQAECSWNAGDKVRFGVPSCKERYLGDRTRI